MKREHLAFLFGGFAFGALFGFAVAYGFAHRPELHLPAEQSTLEGPRGPQSPTEMGAGPSGGAAPMMARVNELKRALAAEPDNVGVLVELADLHQQAALWEQAARFYERALAVEPAHYELLVNLGLCYRGMGSPEQALAAFARAHEIDPGQWQALFNTVVVAATDARDFDTALAALEAIEALEPPPAGLDASHLRQLRDWLEQTRAGQAAENPS
jgi:tetratricopeptide (TPR) repeat protein